MGWPVRLAADIPAGRVELRPIRQRDRAAWRELRVRNGDWLRPWDATSPNPGDVPPTFGGMVRGLLAEARAGRMMPFVITLDGRMAGQLTVNGIIWGSARSCSIGYWVDRALAGRGLAPTAVALAADHCWSIGLHRVEIAIRPENRPSLRVVEKLGFRPEGLRPRFLHIDGDWRDHLVFALNADEVPRVGLTARWRDTQRAQGVASAE